MPPNIAQAAKAQLNLLPRLRPSQQSHINPSLKKIIIMAKNVSPIIIHNNEPVPLGLIKELQPPRVPLIRLVQNDRLLLRQLRQLLLMPRHRHRR